MAAERRAAVTWSGDLISGSGTIDEVGSGAFGPLDVSWPARAEEASGGKTSPEELIAAAHAVCYSMAFSNALAQAGHPPGRLEVSAVCALDRVEGGLKITTMQLSVRGAVDGIDDGQFREIAQQAEQRCPVSNALRGNVDISVEATLG